MTGAAELLAPARALQLHLRRAQPSESRAVREWIVARHYSGTAPPGYVFALEFLLRGDLVGAMLVGRPTARALDPDHWLELTRMHFVDQTPLFVESRGLSLMRKHVRTWFPAVRMLIAYSDPSAGHEGKVYEADGWARFGMTKLDRVGWKSRPGRRAGSPARKVRWIRTP